MNIKLRKQCSGMGLIGWVVTIPVVLVVIAFLFCEANKAYWDHKVTEMCEKDGGVVVHEKIQILKEQYPKLISSSGNVMIPNLSNANSDDPYYITFTELIIREKNPKVRRAETKIIRRLDSKILSLRISYSRGGGDFPTIIAAPSSFSCRNIENINTSLIKSTFSIKGV